MTFEVEQKFPVDNVPSVASRLEGLGAIRANPMPQIDTYFAHPCRDFAKTDEAFRIRCVGEKNFITYKGPKVDASTKTRQEIELPVAQGTSEAIRCEKLVTALGFRSVAAVKKYRTPWTLQWESRQVDIAVDEVEQLGTFVELEISAEEHELAHARAVIGSLAEALNLTRSERRSYLELLLEGG